jgi:DNA-binding NarL/FixJ family response regulator
LTAHADQDLLLEAIRAGAAGYVLTGIGPHEFVGVVRGTLDGDSPVDQELVMRLVRRMAEERMVRHLTEEARQPAYPSLAPSAGRREKPPPGLLTPRELEVLRSLLAGKTNRQIANELHLSLSTVKRHQ